MLTFSTILCIYLGLGLLTLVYLFFKVRKEKPELTKVHAIVYFTAVFVAWPVFWFAKSMEDYES